MRATIEDGKIVLPMEVLDAARFPKNGECEVQARPGEVHVTARSAVSPSAVPAPEEHLRLLRGPAPTAPDDTLPDPADEAD